MLSTACAFAYAETSAAAREPNAPEFKIERNIPYRSAESLAKEGEYARNRCLLDLRLPVGATNFATVVYFHGGGIVTGNKGAFLWPQEGMDRDPVALVSAGYRLLTNATPAQAVGDAAAAVAWTLGNIARYGGDPKKVFVTGISGGGYLTAMVGLDARWLAEYGFKPSDLAGIAPLTGQMTKHFNVRKIGFGDADPQFLPKVDEWAPLRYAAAKDLPPCCFLTGGRDVEWKARVEENALLAASLSACGHKNVEFHETEGNHGGGTYPCRYLLRDFVMRTCNAGGVPGFADGECTVLAGGGEAGPRIASWLQLFWCSRHPGSDVKVVAAAPGDFGRGKGRFGFAPDRVWSLAKESKTAAWLGAGAKQTLRLAASPESMDDVLFDAGKYAAADVSQGAKDLLAAMALVDAMRVNPFVSRVAIDAKKGVAFTPSTTSHKNAVGKKLPDCLNVKVPRVDVREDGIAFTYAPKAMPFPATPEYIEAEKLQPLAKRFNQELLIVEGLPHGVYELAFDGVKAGEFSAEEFETGVNIATLDTPNRRRADSLAQFAGALRDRYAAWTESRSPADMARLVDTYEMMNAVRPAVSRVTLKRKSP